MEFILTVFSELSYWHWFVLAAILIGLELLAPGYVFLWIAVAAGITGLLKLFLPLGWELQLILFGVIAVVTVIYAKKFIKKYAKETDQPTLNRRGDKYIGKVYVLDQAIENGSGKVKVGDTMWRVEGENLPVGSAVKVIAVNGASFVVELEKD